MGNASNVYNLFIGGSLKYEIPLSSTTYVTLSAGYTDLLIKDEFKHLGFVTNTGAIPLKGGIKYYVDNGFFIEGQVGAAFITGGGSTLIAYSPGVGYSFDGGFEAGVRYEGWAQEGSIGQVGLRLAYRFK